MILRLLNWQGVAGIAATICLAALLAVQVVQTRHWRGRSTELETLYREEQASLATTVANARAAADLARAADAANAIRVAAEQRAITERTTDEYEARLAAARAAAQRLQHLAQAPAGSGPRGAAPVPSLPDRTGSTAKAAGQDRFSNTDALTATEQAIQLDELIKWVRRQGKVDNGTPAATNSPLD